MPPKLTSRERSVLSVASNAWAERQGPSGFHGVERKAVRSLEKKGLMEVMGEEAVPGVKGKYLLAQLSPEGRILMADRIALEQSALDAVAEQVAIDRRLYGLENPGRWEQFEGSDLWEADVSVGGQRYSMLVTTDHSGLYPGGKWYWAITEHGYPHGWTASSERGYRSRKKAIEAAEDYLERRVGGQMENPSTETAVAFVGGLVIGSVMRSVLESMQLQLVEWGPDHFLWRSGSDAILAHRRGEDLWGFSVIMDDQVVETKEYSEMRFQQGLQWATDMLNRRGNPRSVNPGDTMDLQTFYTELEIAVLGGEIDLDTAQAYMDLVENGCPPGELEVHRKGYHRSAYTRSDGTRVAAADVPATTFCTTDMGEPGRGPEIIDIEDPGDLGGAGYTDKSKRERHRLLRKCVERKGYRSCLGKLQALEVLGKNTWPKKKLKVIASDRKWLVDQFGGPGSFGPRKKRSKKKSKGKRKNNPDTRKLRVR